MKSLTVLFFCVITFSVTVKSVTAQGFVANYDETNVPAYNLPEILKTNKGKEVKTIQEWEKKRRPELLQIFEAEMFGKLPKENIKTSYELQEINKIALAGKAVRKQVKITFENNGKNAALHLLIYLPKDVDKPVPLFIGANFYGNHTTQPDPAIVITENWVRNNNDYGITENKATEVSRGVRAYRWPVEFIIENGYGLATYYYGDIDPDYDDGFQNGIHTLFYRKGQTKPNDDDWASIAAWGWGLSSALDYFVSDNTIDAKKIAVIGHSRLGKAALHAGVYDERFAMVISNNSGCGGAALSKRAFGETVGRINTSFPHWFNTNFKKYNENEAALSFDQHMFISLVAPRPVYVASAVEDQWADPKGEFLSLQKAAAVYKLYGLENLSDEKMPKVDQPLIKGHTGYHIRSGKHNLLKYDWEQYIAFANKHLK